MQSNHFASLAEDVRKLAIEARPRQLHRLIDLHAAAEAASALRVTAVRTAEGAGVLVSVLKAAAAVIDGVAARGLSKDDAAAPERLRDAVTTPEFMALLPALVRELRQVASAHPGTGACTVASALELWAWTMRSFRTGEMSQNEAGSRAVDELSDAIAPLLAARSLALEVAAKAAAKTPAEAELWTDLCHAYSARVSAAAGSTCAELVFGYRSHLTWDEAGCATCYTADQLEEMEALMPGMSSVAGVDVIEADGSHPSKRGPCVRFDGVDTFIRLRNKLDGCLTGARLAKERAAVAVSRSIATATAAVPAGVGAR
jgi:hypothetical protein